MDNAPAWSRWLGWLWPQRDEIPKSPNTVRIAIDVQDDASNVSDALRLALYFNYKVQDVIDYPKTLKGKKLIVEWLKDTQISDVILIGQKKRRWLESAARECKVNFYSLPALSERPALPSFEEPSIKRKRARELVSARYALYMHIHNPAQLRVAIEAFSEARLHFPDLLCLLSLGFADYSQADFGRFKTAFENEKREKLRGADIVLSEGAQFRQDWVEIANAVCIMSGDNARQWARLALQSMASLVVYNVDLSAEPELSNLRNAGLIGAVGHNGRLGLALAQAIEPEAAAINAVNSITRLTSADDAISHQLEKLFFTEAR